MTRPGSAILLLLCAAFTLTVAETGPRAGEAAPPAGSGTNSLKDHDFLVFDPHYKEARAMRIDRARALGAQLIQRETSGQNIQLSHQILSEVIWLISSSADFKRLDRRLDDLQTSLAHPEGESAAREQNPDGSWGKGYTEWFFKLVGSYPNLDKEAPVPLTFLDRINSPQKLRDYFASVSVSDISRTGVDNEREFNESLSCLIRMILRGRPGNYPYDPGLKDAIMELVLHKLRNPATGYWGERYLHADGSTEYVDDLSITFHVVQYLDGKVPDMDKVVTTTLAIRNRDFPSGWLLNGKPWDHLNMDVADLFRLGWPHASETQRKTISAELNRMLHWCLTESLRPDGSFEFVEGDNSIEEATYYGAAFLARIGFFDKSKRFWTDQDFPEAESIRQRIIAYIERQQKAGATLGDYYRSALNELGDTPK